MAVKLVKYGVAGGVGAAHVGLLYLDGAQGWDEPFKRSSDYPQLIGFGLGLAMDALEVYGEIGETLAIASEPLLIRSVYEAVKHYVGGGTPKKRAQKTKGRWKLIREGKGARPGIPVRVI